MMSDFDPYDALVQMNERLHRLEKAHNSLALEYERTDADLTTALRTLQKTQQHLLKLHEIIDSFKTKDLDK